jgi:drug/metabolite transporter (DMT)-like permease
MHFLDNWLLVAFLAPFFWALVNIIDVYFVEEVYENEYDGTVISGFAQIIPWLTIPFLGLVIPSIGTILMAMLAGFFFIIANFFYFKSLFMSGDATLILIFWNTTAIVVPVLAFLFLLERLSPIHYLGIAITFIGAIIISFSKKIKEENVKKIILIMSGAILFLSLSMVLTREVYSRTSFHGGIMFFSLGAILAGFFFFALRINKYGRGKLINTSKKYYKWFLLIELISLSGVITSQRAIEISPSVSFVSAIESIQPAFIIISSAIVFFILSFFSYSKKEIIDRIYNDQLVSMGYKIVAIIIMAIGIYMINL